MLLYRDMYPTVPGQQDWLRGWKEWAWTRKRGKTEEWAWTRKGGKMAQFVVDKLEDNARKLIFLKARFKFSRQSLPGMT